MALDHLACRCRDGVEVASRPWLHCISMIGILCAPFKYNEIAMMPMTRNNVFALKIHDQRFVSGQKNVLNIVMIIIIIWSVNSSCEPRGFQV